MNHKSIHHLITYFLQAFKCGHFGNVRPLRELITLRSAFDVKKLIHMTWMIVSTRSGILRHKAYFQLTWRTAQTHTQSNTPCTHAHTHKTTTHTHRYIYTHIYTHTHTHTHTHTQPQTHSGYRFISTYPIKYPQRIWTSPILYSLSHPQSAINPHWWLIDESRIFLNNWLISLVIDWLIDPLIFYLSRSSIVLVSPPKFYSITL